MKLVFLSVLLLFSFRCVCSASDLSDRRACFDINPGSCAKMATRGYCARESKQGENQLPFHIVCCVSCQRLLSSKNETKVANKTRQAYFNQIKSQQAAPVHLLQANINRPEPVIKDPFDYNQNYLAKKIEHHQPPNAFAQAVPANQFFPPPPPPVTQRPFFFFQETATSSASPVDYFNNFNNMKDSGVALPPPIYAPPNVVVEYRPSPGILSNSQLPQQYQETYPHVCLDYNLPLCVVNVNRGNCVLQNAFVFEIPFAVYCCQSCRVFNPSTFAAEVTTTPSTTTQSLVPPFVTTTRRTDCRDYDSAICAHWASEQYCNNYGNYADGRPLLEACAYSCGCRLYGCGIC
jgi:hypothetical protein